MLGRRFVIKSDFVPAFQALKLTNFRHFTTTEGSDIPTEKKETAKRGANLSGYLQFKKNCLETDAGMDMKDLKKKWKKLDDDSVKKWADKANELNHKKESKVKKPLNFLQIFIMDNKGMKITEGKKVLSCLNWKYKYYKKYYLSLHRCMYDIYNI